jgi:hypothetical protein
LAAGAPPIGAGFRRLHDGRFLEDNGVTHVSLVILLRAGCK